MDFNFDELKENVNKWHELYDSFINTLDENGIDISISLFTSVQVEPHVYEKCKITNIRKVNSQLIGEYLVLWCIGENRELGVPVYRAFELKTDGKIKDIILILTLIKNSTNKEITTNVVMI